MGSKAFAFYFPSMEPYLLSEASEDDSDIINALANTLQIRLKPVSYTHLDVYKRQMLHTSITISLLLFFFLYKK